MHAIANNIRWTLQVLRINYNYYHLWREEKNAKKNTKVEWHTDKEIGCHVWWEEEVWKRTHQRVLFILFSHFEPTDWIWNDCMLQIFINQHLFHFICGNFVFAVARVPLCVMWHFGFLFYMQNNHHLILISLTLIISEKKKKQQKLRTFAFIWNWIEALISRLHKISCTFNMHTYPPFYLHLVKSISLKWFAAFDEWIYYGYAQIKFVILWWKYWSPIIKSGVLHFSWTATAQYINFISK